MGDKLESVNANQKAEMVRLEKPVLRKLTVQNVAQNAELGNIEKPVLPSNERQIRPLLTDLNHDGERLKVWQDVVQDGEKITASLVQRKGYSGLSEGPWPGLERRAGATALPTPTPSKGQDGLTPGNDRHLPFMG